MLCGHFFILQYFQWSYHFPKSPLNLPCSPTFHSQHCQLSPPTDSPPSLQPILAAVPAHCSLNLPWKCTGILQNLSLKPHPPPSQCSSSFPHAATSPSSTHPAVPAHTQAEGVLVGAAGAIVHHALHGHHFPSFLGFAVQVASLLGCKGSGGLSAGCGCQDFCPSSLGRAQCRGPR